MANAILLKFLPLPTRKSFRNLSGQIFGQLAVLGYVGLYRGRTAWLVQCDCGKTTVIRGGNLLKGARSCGCNHGCGGVTANRQRPSEHAAYHSAKARCNRITHREYARYGKRGIEFRFESFQEFYTELGKKPSPELTLERIDNNGHYEKGNVKWATPGEQNRNTRRVHWLTINDETLCVTDWANRMGRRPSYIWYRLSQGWCGTCAVYLPRGNSCSHITAKS